MRHHHYNHPQHFMEKTTIKFLTSVFYVGVQEDDDEGYDRGGAMPAQQSVFSLTEGGSVPPHKRRKGINPTSTGNHLLALFIMLHMTLSGLLSQPRCSVKLLSTLGCS